MSRSYENEFTEDTVGQAWDRARGYCEGYKCGKQLVWENRDKNGKRGAWNAHHKVPVAKGGSNLLRNCQILCLDCHKKVHGS